MIKGMLAKKMNMTSVYDTHGRIAPVTRVLIEPNFVSFLREKDKDGYKAAQLAVGSKKRATRAEKAAFEKAKLKFFPRHLREVEFDGELGLGQEIKLDEVFRRGVMVDVVAVSKGKGFAGGVKRHGFAGGPKTHGQSDRHRGPGSIGATTTPGRVFKGMKMAGHMGNARVSIFGLEVMGIEKEANTMLVKGSIPGPVGGLVIINKSKKKKAIYHEPEIQALPHLGGEEKEENITEEVKVDVSQPEPVGKE